MPISARGTAATASDTYEMHRVQMLTLASRLNAALTSGPAPERTDWSHVGSISEAHHLLLEVIEAVEACK